MVVAIRQVGLQFRIWDRDLTKKNRRYAVSFLEATYMAAISAFSHIYFCLLSPKDKPTLVFLTSTPEWGKWATARHSYFTPGGKFSGTHWIKSWRSPRAGMDISVEKEISCPNPKTKSGPSSPQPNHWTHYTITNTNPNNLISSESNHNSVRSDKTKDEGSYSAEIQTSRVTKLYHVLGKKNAFSKTCDQWL